MLHACKSQSVAAERLRHASNSRALIPPPSHNHKKELREDSHFPPATVILFPWPASSLPSPLSSGHARTVASAPAVQMRPLVLVSPLQPGGWWARRACLCVAERHERR